MPIQHFILRGHVTVSNAIENQDIKELVREALREYVDKRGSRAQAEAYVRANYMPKRTPGLYDAFEELIQETQAKANAINHLRIEDFVIVHIEKPKVKRTKRSA